MNKQKLFEMYHYKNYDKKVNRLILLIIFCFFLELVTIPVFTKQILDIEIPNKNIRRRFLFWWLICSFEYYILLFGFKVLYC